jgi:hypothetical protein
MRSPLLLKVITRTGLAALAAAGALAGGLATAPAASACDSYAAAVAAARSHPPISADAPFDTIAWNAPMSRYPAIRPSAGTDLGHLPRWKHFADGRVLLREDRVTLRLVPGSHSRGYTNVNPRIRSYWLDPDAPILAGPANYHRMTGRTPSGTVATYPVGRQQFLDSFNTGGHDWFRFLKYKSVYRLTFDRSHTHIRRIVEVPIFLGC